MCKPNRICSALMGMLVGGGDVDGTVWREGGTGGRASSEMIQFRVRKAACLWACTEGVDTIVPMTKREE